MSVGQPSQLWFTRVTQTPQNGPFPQEKHRSRAAPVQSERFGRRARSSTELGPTQGLVMRPPRGGPVVSSEKFSRQVKAAIAVRAFWQTLDHRELPDASDDMTSDGLK